ncbi:helix-turn-helix transcriptional regulator [Aquisalimonas lutea]|uniref:helix-turn-helix transcriptional regulator n=1 Tax=Aquisalimonas lutea TaxID=1327750 RepID=UPI0025B334AA|nr:helix-turn-helix transcriptional regulator [Aquisalimonas lutea]MDN3518855.1 helix-turn-helix transcriptional regulator [Aquisalimonas lutea]
MSNVTRHPGTVAAAVEAGPARQLQRHVVHPGEIAARAAPAGAHYRLGRGMEPTGTGVLDGGFLLWQSPSGLIVHASSGREILDSTATIELPARFVVTVVLEGTLAFSLDGCPFRVGRADRSQQAACLGITTTRSSVLSRRIHPGQLTRKVSVAVDQHWLARWFGQPLPDGYEILGHHLCHRYWQASPEAEALALALLNPPALDTPLQQLVLESRALELLSVAVQAVREDPTTPAEGIGLPDTRHDMQRLNRVLDFIEQHGIGSPGIRESARHAGMSVSTLQRHFKRAFGETFLQYTRRRNLERARTALQKNELSIGEASYLAGYRHVPNFIHAYRRMFGQTPGATRGT